MTGRAAKKDSRQPHSNLSQKTCTALIPKFDVRDANGTKWRVKLGDEARPEVVASRLLWAVGYFVNDDYVIASARVDELHLQRGEKLVKDGEIEDARFEKEARATKEDRNLELEGQSIYRHKGVQWAARDDGGDEQLGSEGRE